MLQRNIFKKKKSKKIYYFFLFLLIFLLSIFYLYFIYINRINNDDIFLVKEYSDSYYSIPEDKKGKNIPNTNIKILDYKYNQTIKIDEIISDYDFSIQLYSSQEYNDIISKRISFLNNNIINEDDLFIAALKHNLGIDYLLLYKNFESYRFASDFCSNYLEFIDFCLIVNLQKLD